MPRVYSFRGFRRGGELYGSDPFLLSQYYYLPALLSFSGSRSRLPLGSGTITHITKPLTLTVEPNHQEKIPFFFTSAPVHKIILGLPWLQCHKPTISWSRVRILDWSPECRKTCFPVLCGSTSVESPVVSFQPGGISGSKGDILRDLHYLSPSSSPLGLCHLPVFRCDTSVQTHLPSVSG
jgi:hypothetical protein